jgi:4-hydroxybenzoate polyprenyltransferase
MQLPYSVTAHRHEMIKNLENLKGDLANDYKTIPIVYGEMVSKSNYYSLSDVDFYLCMSLLKFMT